MRFRNMLCLGVALLALCVASTALAAIPPLLNFQGVLYDKGSPPKPVRNQWVDVEFRIYDADTLGTQFWMESDSILTDGSGGFSHMLGSVNPIPISVFAGPDRWLGMTIVGDPEMFPRTRLASVPYS